MRRLALLAAVALVVGGCGGKKAAPAKPAAPRDPGKQVLDAFVSAAGRGDAKAMWALLSRASQRRLGPLARFERTTAVELAEGVGSFARSRYEEVVSERVTDSFGVVAIAGVRHVEGTREYNAYATALRLEGRFWRVELGGPVHIRPLGPAPGAREKTVLQIAGAVSSRRGGAGTAVLWLDGVTLNPKASGTAGNVTLFANLASPLARGRHNVVVFASGSADASATAWTFSVR